MMSRLLIKLRHREVKPLTDLRNTEIAILVETRLEFIFGSSWVNVTWDAQQRQLFTRVQIR